MHAYRTVNHGLDILHSYTVQNHGPKGGMMPNRMMPPTSIINQENSTRAGSILTLPPMGCLSLHIEGPVFIPCIEKGPCKFLGNKNSMESFIPPIDNC